MKWSEGTGPQVLRLQLALTRQLPLRMTQEFACFA